MLQLTVPYHAQWSSYPNYWYSYFPWSHTRPDIILYSTFNPLHKLIERQALLPLPCKCTSVFQGPHVSADIEGWHKKWDGQIAEQTYRQQTSNPYVILLMQVTQEAHCHLGKMDQRKHCLGKTNLFVDHTLLHGWIYQNLWKTGTVPIMKSKSSWGIFCPTVQAVEKNQQYHVYYSHALLMPSHIFFLSTLVQTTSLINV